MSANNDIIIVILYFISLILTTASNPTDICDKTSIVTILLQQQQILWYLSKVFTQYIMCLNCLIFPKHIYMSFVSLFNLFDDKSHSFSLVFWSLYSILMISIVNNMNCSQTQIKYPRTMNVFIFK